MPPNQWRKTYLVHSAKAFTVVVATVAAERYVYAYVYTTFDLANSVRLLKCFHLFLNHGFWAYVLILLWDWAVAKAISSDPSRLPTLRRLAVTGVILYAILPSFGLWWVQTTILQAEARKPPIGDLWETTNRLAAAVRENPTYNLHTVEEHLVLTFSSPRAAYELYEIGEQQGIFPFRKRSYAGLQRWGALDNLLVALVEHARIAAKRGDWQRCRTALQLALRTMEKAAELQVPNDLKPRLDTRMVPVQSFALIHIRGGFERIYPLLKEIASWSPAHRHQMERALQQGRRVGDVLVEVGRKSRPLLGVQRQPAQRRQLEVIFDESMRRLSLQLLEWDYSIEDGLQRIWAMEQQKHTR
ncbi:MAG: hypothetical protein KatS3mg022_1535 [Armatimonadota bacterium]|nr:MAG: hypothetical protein KatS3mg022_1535 [Armatimonadota bacterium]